jgi:hypothetical protein
MERKNEKQPAKVICARLVVQIASVADPDPDLGWTRIQEGNTGLQNS